MLYRRVWIAGLVLLLLAAVTSGVSAQFLIDGSTGPSVPLNTAPPRPVNPPAALIGQPGRLIVNTDNLNLRSGPGPDYTQVGVLDGGTQLIALGSNGELGDNRWWFVEVGGLRGWVTNEFVVIRGDLRGLPIVTPQGEIERPSLYIGAINALYSAPRLSGDYLCDVGGNLFYYVTGIDTAAADWIRIEAPCGGRMVTGWIQADRGLLRNPANVAIPVIGG